MDHRGEELAPVGASREGCGAAGEPPAERDSDAAPVPAEPQAAPATPPEAPPAAAAPAAPPVEAGTPEACPRPAPTARSAAPAGADDGDDGEKDSPADFFGFFVDVHKNLAQELGDELKKIPEASGKICTRLGLPICAQMRTAVKGPTREPPPPVDQA